MFYDSKTQNPTNINQISKKKKKRIPSYPFAVASILFPLILKIIPKGIPAVTLGLEGGTVTQEITESPFSWVLFPLGISSQPSEAINHLFTQHLDSSLNMWSSNPSALLLHYRNLMGHAWHHQNSVCFWPFHSIRVKPRESHYYPCSFGIFHVMSSWGRGTGVAVPRTIWRLMQPVFKWNLISALLCAAVSPNSPHPWDFCQSATQRGEKMNAWVTSRGR